MNEYGIWVRAIDRVNRHSVQARALTESAKPECSCVDPQLSFSGRFLLHDVRYILLIKQKENSTNEGLNQYEPCNQYCLLKFALAELNDFLRATI